VAGGGQRLLRLLTNVLEACKRTSIPVKSGRIQTRHSRKGEIAAAAKKLIEMFGNRNIRAIAVNRVNDKSDEVIVELDFVPGLAPHLHGFTLQVNGLTCGYAGTGPSNLYEVLQAAGVSEAQVAREDITQKSTKTIPLRLERAVTQYGDFQFA
jgi:hypothetical protein